MNFYCLICTRFKKGTPLLKNLISYLCRANVKIKLLVDQESIFEGYQKGINLINPKPEDIIILCHDDIEIISNIEDFKKELLQASNKEVGFIGPAGTTEFDRPCIWWDHYKWQLGMHSGAIYHHEENKGHYPTVYGPHGEVSVLDGVFLAARAEVLLEIGLEKPAFFEGKWDFYDIYYTTQAHLKKYKNKTVDIKMCHYSIGNTDGRDSWHKNRESYIKEYASYLPLKTKK
jgi:hypothetical protein